MKNNVIPPITNPLGQHWDQPKADDVLVDDTHAVMTEHSLSLLSEYSHSMPSGVYHGKMWKCANHKEPGCWWLVWYGFDEDPGFCSNNYREILITD